VNLRSCRCCEAGKSARERNQEQAVASHLRHYGEESGQRNRSHGSEESDDPVLHGLAAAAALDIGTRRRAALSTMFVIVGPRSDPAHVWSSWSAVGALEKIAATHAPYQRSPATSVAADVEASLWRAAEGSSPEGPAPDTVEETLARAEARGAYMIVDRPTFRRLGAQSRLIALFEGDPALIDTYTVAELRPASTYLRRGRAFWHWFHSPKGEAAVRLAAVDGDRDYSFVH
jgi:tungstate transport system substrate-binding protein